MRACVIGARKGGRESAEPCRDAGVSRRGSVSVPPSGKNNRAGSATASELKVPRLGSSSSRFVAGVLFPLFSRVAGQPRHPKGCRSICSVNSRLVTLEGHEPNKRVMMGLPR